MRTEDIDIYYVIEVIDDNIEHLNDDDLSDMAKCIIKAIYEEEEIEKTASYVVNHLAQKCKNAGLRADKGFNVEINDTLYNKYHDLLLSVIEGADDLTYSIDPNIFDYWGLSKSLLGQSNNITAPYMSKPKQQQKSHKPARSKGRPKETLKDKMVNDADGSKLQKLHAVMDGKKGKDAALIVIACIKKGWMQKPTFTQVTEEFGDIGTQQGFTKYLYENWFTKDEIEGAINSLD